MACYGCGGSLIYLQAFGPPPFCAQCEEQIEQVLKAIAYHEKVVEAATFQLDVEKAKQKIASRTE